jgi:hypothetical protein
MEVRRVLKPNGLLIFTTANLNSFRKSNSGGLWGVSVDGRRLS